MNTGLTPFANITDALKENPLGERQLFHYRILEAPISVGAGL